MKRSRALLTNWSAVGLTALLTTPVVHGAPPEFVAGQILVKPAAGLNPTAFDRVLAHANARAQRKLEGIDVHVVAVPKGREQAVVDALSHNPHVQFAEVDRYVAPTMTANDPSFPSQWHLAKMQASSAWDVALGTGVTVAVVDTGVYSNHPDLLGKIVVGRNVTTGTVDPNDTSDIYGHGTWVSGVVTEVTNNGIGGASVAPNTQVMPIRITDRTDGLASFSDMASGIKWAADHGARVANLSYAGAAGSSTVASAASYMMSKNGVVIVAAGNDNTDYGYSNSPYLYVAAATDSNDAKASFSSYGAFVDIAAPGVSIYTTNRSGTYSLVSGTSFATPNVAGTAAVVMSANPVLGPNDVLNVISKTAVDLGAAGWDPNFGAGRVNESAAAKTAATYQALDNTAPSVGIGAPAANSTLSGQVGVQVSASDSSGVKSVSLLINGTAFATSTAATNGVYSFAWDTTQYPDGAYTLTATATDNAGNTGTSASVSESVRNASADTVAPTATLSNPVQGQLVSTSVTVSASGSDNVAMKQIAVYGDGKLLCSSTATVSCSWNTKRLAKGTTHTVTAIATDTSNNSASTSVTVTKN